MDGETLTHTSKRKRSNYNYSNVEKISKMEINEILKHYPTICQDRGSACFLKLISDQIDSSDFDCLVDCMAGTSQEYLPKTRNKQKQPMLPTHISSKLQLVRKYKRSLLHIDLNEMIFLFLVDLSVATLHELLYAGFVLFAQSLEDSTVPVPVAVSAAPDRGILSLELGGNRLDGTDDYGTGGRIVLILDGMDGTGTPIPTLTVGKKTVQSVCDVSEFDSMSGTGGTVCVGCLYRAARCGLDGFPLLSGLVCAIVEATVHWVRVGRWVHEGKARIDMPG